MSSRRSRPRAGQRARRGVVWLLRAQEPDGSWFGRWGANYVYGVGAVVPALIAAGVKPSKPAIRRAVAWLENHQNPDGGWGEDLRSYNDPALAGRGESTASQTAWALLALLAAGEHRGAAAERGIRWLAQTQRADGSWDQPQFTGTGIPGDVYINYHLYRLAFPISALGRYVEAHAGELPLLGQAAVQGSINAGGKMLVRSGAMRLASDRGVPSARGGRPGQALGLAR